ncbi:response regulator transcription factor [Waterburya agarophytonicola K14]|uniref:Response regulator transcription factor n=1 Tax=Waterburya agarophytonicola KI4 TaxID=2874699 RepID=A0A964BU18_9CYAN|nr:response regulator transcription factor [Waterburya agarophytonicola]MCC0177860.1 response regulator transcription factor [Waterburya agarophytonicola KI4]
MENTQKKVLIVDDDLALQHLINRFLSYNNYITEIAPNCAIARQKFQSFQPDLVFLDINLPDDTGLRLCEEMSKTNVMIVMLSSMTDSSYILEAFARGADDYIAKPFDLQILKARVEALFRRGANKITSPTINNSIVLDNLKINFYRREVILNNSSILLTALEFDLLYFLANNPNRVWDRAELISAIWNKDDYDGDDRKVDIHIGRIRKKIGDANSEFIKTVWGRGYMFELSSCNKVKLAD